MKYFGHARHARGRQMEAACALQLAQLVVSSTAASVGAAAIEHPSMRNLTFGL